MSDGLGYSIGCLLGECYCVMMDALVAARNRYTERECCVRACKCVHYIRSSPVVAMSEVFD